MSEEKYEPANIDAESRIKLLCITPPGPFDANCSLLKEVTRCYNKKQKLTYASAFIPSNRVKDFKTGERARGRCGFYVARRKDGSKEKGAAHEDPANPEVGKVPCFLFEAPFPFSQHFTCFRSVRSTWKPFIPDLRRSFLLQAARLNAYLQKEDNHCSCGPDDLRNEGGSSRTGTPERSQGSREKEKEGSRMDRTALGYSCRVGCQVRFTTRT